MTVTLNKDEILQRANGFMRECTPTCTTLARNL